jgi:hypothetical protein
MEEKAMKLLKWFGLTTLFIMNCSIINKQPQWDAILDDCSIDPIIQKSMKIQKQMDTAVKYGKSGNTARALKTWQQSQKDFNALGNFYLPLSNAKIRVSQARKCFLLNDKSGAEAEITNTRMLILQVRSKMTDKNIQEIDQLLTDTEMLEKEIKSLTKAHDSFHALGVQLNELLSKNIQ